jgi:hypothetical protein
VLVSSLANADIANPDHGLERPVKITLFGHTGQDPAPDPGEANWDPEIYSPSWNDAQVNNKPLPTKNELFSITFIEEAEITFDFPVSTPDWSTDFEVSEDRLDETRSPRPPNGGSVPTPPASFLFALGFLNKRRRVE